MFDPLDLWPQFIFGTHSIRRELRLQRLRKPGGAGDDQGFLPLLESCCMWGEPRSSPCSEDTGPEGATGKLWSLSYRDSLMQTSMLPTVCAGQVRSSVVSGSEATLQAPRTGTWISGEGSPGMKGCLGKRPGGAQESPGGQQVGHSRWRRQPEQRFADPREQRTFRNLPGTHGWMVAMGMVPAELVSKGKLWRGRVL